MRRYEPIAGITVGASDSDSTIPIPNNRRLLMLRLFATGVAAGPVTVYGANVISDILVYVGTRLVLQTTMQELLDVAALSGFAITPSATVGVPMFFADPKRASVMDEQVTAWDLFGSENVTIKARTVTALTGVTLKAVLDYDDGFTTNAQGNRILNVIRIDPVNLGALGTVADILSPVIPVDLPIQRIFAYPAAGVTITSVRVTINGSQIVQDLTQAENINFLSDYGLVAAAGNGKVFPIVFDASGQLFDGLQPVQSLKLTINQSGAGAVKLVLHRRAAGY